MSEVLNNISDYKNILNRALNAEKNYKFNLSSAHYYSILTQMKLDIDESTTNNIRYSLLFNSILIQPSGLKSNFLKYVISLEETNNFIIHYSTFIKKMLANKIIKNKDLEIFISKNEDNIPNNIKELINFNYNILEKSIFEHNIYCISLYYDNIDISLLGILIDNNDCNNIKSNLFKMIVEGKLEGKIDEHKNYIFFTNKEDNDFYNKQIKNFCNKVLHFNEYYDTN